ncbi:hypothetical protein CMV_022349 [Castanea mollissima]|uniref:Transmembrane protein n=1 Tax=Castanea mollissima TaxID=60419 RepID=A0A8J4QE11_9ROSI|nr:hypothetical protein CMV_022349 [Castanea mollissima]
MAAVWVDLDGGSVDLGWCSMATAWVWVGGFGVVCDGGLIGGVGPWLWLGIDLAWDRGYGDNAGGGVEISFRWVLMGVLNGFFFDFLWVSLHGWGGCVVTMVVSLVVVAKLGFMVADVGFICLDFCFDFFCGFLCVVVGFLWQRWW